MIKPKFALLLKIGALLLVIAGVIIAVVVVSQQSGNEKPDVTDKKIGAVVTNGIECAEIGMSILKKGGSAVDSAIAAIICDGISCPQSTGLGGGFLATIYTKDKGKLVSVNAREVAPKLAHKDMFENGSSAVGGLAIAVPGELKGLWEIHQAYGKLNWSELFEPNIKLCREGHEVSEYLASAMKDREKRILAEPSLREIFIDSSTNTTWQKGHLLKRLKLAETLEIIAKEGSDALYSINGSLLQPLLDDIQKFQGIITKEDFLDYKVVWGEPHSVRLDEDNQLYTAPLAGSGAVLAFILNILRQYDLKDDDLSYHRTIEAFKFGYAKRTMLGDDVSEEINELVKNLTNVEFAKEIKALINDERTFNDFAHYGANVSVPEDHGTAHVSVLAPNGDAVSITSTINFV